MSPSKHFFFKYKTGNKGMFDFDEVETNKLSLSIYFGEWNVADYINNFEGFSDEYKKYLRNNRKQIDSFMQLTENNYLWIYYDRVFCFKTTGNVYDGNEKEAKTIDCVLVKSFKKIDLPEVFANINSNQKYNRKTIVEFEGLIRDIANVKLTTDKRIKVSINQIFDCISPQQFETLIFLIFNKDNYICSAYRGGTLPDYDLKVLDKKSDERFYIQIKKKNLAEKEALNISNNEKVVVVHTGEYQDISKRIYGRSWLLDQISTDKKINEWLEFNLQLFSIEV